MKDETVLLVVDVQGKLAEIVYESEKLLRNIETLIKGAHLLDLPIIWVEQYPKGLGSTQESLKKHLQDEPYFEKISFSAYRNEQFKSHIDLLNRKNVLLTGIESHVCVYQTGKDLLRADYSVQIVEDAMSSRTKENKEIGIKKLNQLGATSTSVEMALFELMETAEIDSFREISRLIK